jgi:adenylate cyclase
VPPLAEPPRARARLQALVSHPTWELVVGLFTLAAVFGFPAFTLASPAGLQQPGYLAAVFVFFGVFALDLLLRLVAFGKSYLFSLYFVVDSVATLSLLTELPGAVYATQSESGAWPNARVLRMSVYVTRLSRLARQSRTMLRLREVLFQRRTRGSASAAEQSATLLQHELETQFNSLVALFVVLALFFIPLREAFTARDDLHEALRQLSRTPAGDLLRAQEDVLRADPRVLLLAPAAGPSLGQAQAVASARGLAPYEMGRYQEAGRVLWISHREERLAGAQLDILLALFIVAVMLTMSTLFVRATDRVLLRPLRDLQRSIEAAIHRNDALGFLRHVEDTEPVTFLQRVFIPLLERLVAAVNSEARENILSADAGPVVRSRDWAIAFTDIQNYTALMETLGQDGFTAINEYFRHCAAVVAEHGGDIFEHTGDGFIVTLPGDGKERRAFDMGVRIIQSLERITATEEWRALLSHPAWAQGTLRHIRTRIGIHKGLVTTGRIGNERVCRYGMIGEAANIASRLESANKQFGTWLLVTEDIAAHAPEELRPHTRRIDRVIVVGTKTPVSLFTYDFAPPARYAEFRQAFDAGVDRYVAGDWAAARERLEASRALWPEDPAGAALLRRLEQVGPAAPADWPGAFKMAQK